MFARLAESVLELNIRVSADFVKKGAFLGTLRIISAGS